MSGTNRPDSPRTAGPAGDRAGPSLDAVTSEDVHLRNYDAASAHDVEVRLATPGGDEAFARRYYLEPADAESELGAVPPGTYEVTVRVDGDHERTAHCRVDNAPTATVLVEVGNGVVSVTGGRLR